MAQKRPHLAARCVTLLLSAVLQPGDAYLMRGYVRERCTSTIKSTWDFKKFRELQEKRVRMELERLDAFLD